jgi:hypothetical protein
MNLHNYLRILYTIHSRIGVGVDDPSLEKYRTDFADQQAELTGLSNGKMDRFFTGENSRRSRDGDGNGRKERAGLTALDLLLLDPVYRQTYERVSNTLNDAQERLDRAILRTTESIERLEALTAELEERAAKLGSGTAVFRAADGTLYVADGRRLSEAESASLSIPLNAPSWEQYKSAQDALDRAQARQKRLGEIQTEILDPAREKLNDRGDPPSIKGLQGLEADLKKVDKELDALEKSKPAFNAVPAPAADAPLAELKVNVGVPAP